MMAAGLLLFGGPFVLCWPASLLPPCRATPSAQARAGRWLGLPQAPPARIMALRQAR